MTSECPTPGWEEHRLYYSGSGTDAIAWLASQVGSPAKSYERPVSWWFIRHWDGGPHIRLRTRPQGALNVDGMETSFRQYCSRQESDPDRPKLDEYLAAAGAMAAREGTSSYLSGLVEPGSIRAVTFVPDRGAFGAHADSWHLMQSFGFSSALAVDARQSSSSVQREVLYAVSCAVGITFCAGSPVAMTDPSPAAGQYAPLPRLEESWCTPRALDRIRGLARNIVDRASVELPGDAGSDWIVCWARASLIVAHMMSSGQQPVFWGRAVHLMANRLGVPSSAQHSLYCLLDKHLDGRK